jgi:hypothetical protein
MPGRPPPPAPPDLDPAEADIWNAIVASLPADWITGGSAPLLTNLCRHVHNANLLAADIGSRREDIDQARQLDSAASEPKAISRARALRLSLEKSLRSLLTAHGYQSDRITRLSTKLRLSQQSRYRADAAGRATAREPLRPWEDWKGYKRQ